MAGINDLTPRDILEGTDLLVFRRQDGLDYSITVGKAFSDIVNGTSSVKAASEKALGLVRKETGYTPPAYDFEEFPSTTVAGDIAKWILLRLGVPAGVYHAPYLPEYFGLTAFYNSGAGGQIIYGAKTLDIDIGGGVIETGIELMFDNGGIGGSMWPSLTSQYGALFKPHMRDYRDPLA